MKVPDKVAICIPTYNQAAYLEKAVRSALAQTHPCEVWVSDDASTDETPTVMARLQQEFPKLIYRRQPKNLGIAANAAFLMQQPDCDYLVRLDSDDLLHPEYVATLASFLEDNPAAGYAHCAVNEINQQGKIIRERRLGRPTGFISADKALKMAVTGYRVAANICMFRKQAIAECRWFNPDVTYVEDWFLSVQMADKGWGNVYSDKIMASYRWWTDGVIRPKRKILEIRGCVGVYEAGLLPAYKRRGWPVNEIAAARLSRAKGFCDALDEAVFTAMEKDEMIASLIQLANTSKFERHLKLLHTPLGIFLKIYRRLKNGVRQAVGTQVKKYI